MVADGLRAKIKLFLLDGWDLRPANEPLPCMEQAVK
jgi:hypothetical protein